MSETAHKDAADHHEKVAHAHRLPRSITLMVTTMKRVSMPQTLTHCHQGPMKGLG
jgi:hypothetical protein